MRKPVFVQPSYEDVLRTLYILIRHETDVLRNVILPIGPKDIVTDPMLHVGYCNGVLTATFFEAPVNATYRRCSTRDIRHWREKLARQRCAYFRWKNRLVGPMFLPDKEHASYAIHDDHINPPRSMERITLLDEERAFADRHLYQPLLKDKRP